MAPTASPHAFDLSHFSPSAAPVDDCVRLAVRLPGPGRNVHLKPSIGNEFVVTDRPARRKKSSEQPPFRTGAHSLRAAAATRPPPSATNTAPVTNEASSDARKRQQLAFRRDRNPLQRQPIGDIAERRLRRFPCAAAARAISMSLISSLTQCMVRPCVARVFVELFDCGLASMYPASDWSVSRSRATMDISARAISLADRPRLGHLGHQCSHAPGRPILHLVLSSRRPRRVTRTIWLCHRELLILRGS